MSKAVDPRKAPMCIRASYTLHNPGGTISCEDSSPAATELGNKAGSRANGQWWVTRKTDERSSGKKQTHKQSVGAAIAEPVDRGRAAWVMLVLSEVDSVLYRWGNWDLGRELHLARETRGLTERRQAAAWVRLFGDRQLLQLKSRSACKLSKSVGMEIRDQG